MVCKWPWPRVSRRSRLYSSNSTNWKSIDFIDHLRYNPLFLLFPKFKIHLKILNQNLLKFIAILAIVGIAYLGAFYFYPEAIHLFFEEFVTKQAVIFLQNLGYPAELSNFAGKLNAINLSNSPVLRVESGCDGVDLLALYLAFALAFPGPWKHKAWYIPLGLILIHLFNVVRVAALVVIASYSVEVMEFNHKYTFLILVYSFVFLLWYFWIKQFALPNASKKALQG